MNLWPFRYLPPYEHRCPLCGYQMLRAPNRIFCAYVTCPEGKKNYEAARG